MSHGPSTRSEHPVGAEHLCETMRSNATATSGSKLDRRSRRNLNASDPRPASCCSRHARARARADEHARGCARPARQGLRRTRLKTIAMLALVILLCSASAATLPRWCREERKEGRLRRGHLADQVAHGVRGMAAGRRRAPARGLQLRRPAGATNGNRAGMSTTRPASMLPARASTSCVTSLSGSSRRKSFSRPLTTLQSVSSATLTASPLSICVLWEAGRARGLTRRPPIAIGRAPQRGRTSAP